jgi:hypothetical protein
LQGVKVSIILTEVQLTGLSPFLISESSVSVVLEGENSLRNAGASSTGVECGEFSNLTFASVESGSLTVEAGNGGSGIGTAANGRCASLEFVNGSISSKGGTGIGAGPAGPGGTTLVCNLLVRGGIVEATASKIIIILHLFGLAPAGYVTAPDYGPEGLMRGGASHL